MTKPKDSLEHQIEISEGERLAKIRSGEIEPQEGDPIILPEPNAADLEEESERLLEEALKQIR